MHEGIATIVTVKSKTRLDISVSKRFSGESLGDVPMSRKGIQNVSRDI